MRKKCMRNFIWKRKRYGHTFPHLFLCIINILRSIEKNYVNEGWIGAQKGAVPAILPWKHCTNWPDCGGSKGTPGREEKKGREKSKRNSQQNQINWTTSCDVFLLPVSLRKIWSCEHRNMKSCNFYLLTFHLTSSNPKSLSSHCAVV